MAEDFLPYLIDLELMWQGAGEVSWLSSNKIHIKDYGFSKSEQVWTKNGTKYSRPGLH